MARAPPRRRLANEWSSRARSVRRGAAAARAALGHARCGGSSENGFGHRSLTARGARRSERTLSRRRRLLLPTPAPLVEARNDRIDVPLVPAHVSDRSAQVAVGSGKGGEGAHAQVRALSDLGGALLAETDGLNQPTDELLGASELGLGRRAFSRDVRPVRSKDVHEDLQIGLYVLEAVGSLELLERFGADEPALGAQLRFCKTRPKPALRERSRTSTGRWSKLRSAGGRSAR